MNRAKVSVIIPCYNYGKFLTESVDSVICQTYTNWECLVIDDGSIDNTKEIAEKLAEKDARVRYFYKPNGGLSSARNYGIERATGDFLCFLDADDLFDKKKIEAQLSVFDEDSSADIVYGNAMFFKDNLQNLYSGKNYSKKSELSTFSGRGLKLLALLSRSNITVVSAPLIKKSVFSKAGNFDIAYKSYEDWHFWTKCALVGCSFVYCEWPEVCTYIRFGHESMMSDSGKMLRAGIQLRKFMASHLPTSLQPYNLYRLFRSQLKLTIKK
jgi:glycosyltransferase involved in cell wall biosynthesis